MRPVPKGVDFLFTYGIFKRRRGCWNESFLELPLKLILARLSIQKLLSLASRGGQGLYAWVVRDCPGGVAFWEKGVAGLEGKVSIYVVWGAEPRRGTR